MKAFYIIALTIVFFTSNAFSYHCYFRSYSGDIRVADINGRQIYALFSSHLSREEMFGATDAINLIKGLGSTITAQEYVNNLHRFLDRHTDKITSEKSDFHQLSRLLSSKQIDWIGVEAIESLLDFSVQEYLDHKGVLNIREESFPAWNQQNTEDMLYLVSPVFVKIIAEEYPSVLGKPRVVALEDTNLHEAALSLNAELSRLINRIALVRDRMSPQQQIFWDILGNHFYNVISNEDQSYNSQELKEEGFNLFADNPDIVGLVRSWFDLLDRVFANDSERDTFAVDTILNQGGNGVVLRGIGHQKNMESRLTKACLESTKI